MKTKIFLIVLFLLFCFGLNVSAGQNANSGCKTSTMLPTGQFSMHIKNFTFDSQVWDFDLIYQNNLFFKVQNIIQNPCFLKIPSEIWPSDKYANNPYPAPPSGYNSVIPWLTIVPAKDAQEPGTVTIASLELWEIKDGLKTLLFNKLICSQCTDNKVWGFKLPLSSYRDPSAWCKIGEGSGCCGVELNLPEVEITTNNNKTIIQIKVQPNFVYHIWSPIDLQGQPTQWHYPVSSDAEYAVKAQVKIEGDALTQIGLDFWKEEPPSSGLPSVNKQGANSFWYCADSKWQELKAGPL